MNIVTQCRARGGYAEWRCELDTDHDGEHRDALDRTWEGEPWRPVIDADKITWQTAEKVLRDKMHGDDDGEVVIDGIKVAWWADDEQVWFFNPGDDPQDEDSKEIIARFIVERTVVRA